MHNVLFLINEVNGENCRVKERNKYIENVNIEFYHGNKYQIKQEAHLTTTTSKQVRKKS